MSTQRPERIRLARISADPLSVDTAIGTGRDRSVGGVGLFVGVVRDVDEGADVVALDYTAHPSAEAGLLACAERVAGRHDVLAVAVEHRVGHLEVGDLAVVVAVGAVHRGCRAGGVHRVDQRDQGAGADLEGTAVRLRRYRLGRPAVTGRA